MKSTVHNYPFLSSILFWVFNLFAIYMLVGGLISSLYYGITDNLNYLYTYPFFLVFGLVTLFVANMFTEIISDEDGLLVRFCFWRFRVRWSELVEVKPDFISSLYKPLAKVFSISTTYVVKTRTLTLFHRFYGLYVFSFYPSFFMSSSINGFEQLNASIQNKKFVQKSEK